MLLEVIESAIGKAKSIMRRIVRIWSEPALAKTKHEKVLWERESQDGEFRFHLKNKWRQSEKFMGQTIKLFDFFGFAQNQYEGKTIIDLGAGSKLRSKYFAGANIIVIEPLADRFLKEIKWCDLAEAKQVYSIPAEERVAECVNKADLVISINVLDHCYNFDQIIENISAYLNDNGLAFLSFDKHEETDEMHPLRLNESICEEIFLEKGLIVEAVSKGAGKIIKTYGHGDYCLNYRLKKAQQSASADS